MENHLAPQQTFGCLSHQILAVAFGFYSIYCNNFRWEGEDDFEKSKHIWKKGNMSWNQLGLGGGLFSRTLQRRTEYEPDRVTQTPENFGRSNFWKVSHGLAGLKYFGLKRIYSFLVVTQSFEFVKILQPLCLQNIKPRGIHRASNSKKSIGSQVCSLIKLRKLILGIPNVHKRNWVRAANYIFLLRTFNVSDWKPPCNR